MTAMSRVHASRSTPVLARALCALGVAVIVLSPGFTGLSAAAPSGGAALIPPDCSVPPGLVVPPDPITPLSWPDQPVVQGTLAGALPGAGRVTSGGEYQFRLPIDVPPGRAGMEPSLALTYASRGKNGYVGLGFQLEGFSAIERCPKTFATEGHADGVHLEQWKDVRDVFCLDGHKLVAIHGSYGGDGTEYRTEDDIFAKIISTAKDGTTIGFQVWTREGTIRTYAPVNVVYSDDQEYPFAWPLKEERDRSGNAVRYVYETDHALSAQGTPILEYFPTEIDYTVQTGKVPEEPGQRSVKLHYEARPDPSFFMVGSVEVKTTQRLKSIDAYAPGAATPGPVWRYQLSYDESPGSGVSRLVRVERSGALGGRLQAKTFAWESTTGPTYEVKTYPGMGLIEPPIVLDLDGDGREEMLQPWNDEIFLRTTVDPAYPLAEERKIAGGWSGLILSEITPADLDGDGRAELIMPNRTMPEYDVFWLAPGHTPSDPSPLLWSLPIAGESYDPFYNSPLHVGDLDGDGRPDLLKGDPVGPKPDWAWSYRQNQGSTVSFGPKVSAGTTESRLRSLSGRNLAYGVDGGTFRGTLFVGLTPFVPGSFTGGLRGFSVDAAGTPIGMSNTPYMPAPMAFADMNGDGRLEDLYLYNDFGDHWQLCAGGGGAFELGSYEDPWPRGDDVCASLDLEGIDPAQSGAIVLRVADLDADGKDDVLIVHPSADPDEQKVLGVVKLDASLTLTQKPIDIPVPDAIGDFNGDGLLDLAARDVNGWHIYRQTGSGTGDRLVSVADEGSTASREEVVYAGAWSPDPEPASCAYPQRCMRHGFMVVREHRIDPGEDVAPVNGTRVERHLYSYEDPRFDVRGRGFLGFGVMREWEPARRAQTITTFDNVSSDSGIYPFAFRPKTVEHAVVFANATGRARVERITITDMIEHLNGNKSYFVHPSTWSSLEWEDDVTVNLDDAAKVHITGIDAVSGETALRERHGSSTYDSFGNALDAKITTTGGVTTEVVSTYDVRVADWLVALRQSETVHASDASGNPPPPPRHRDYEHDARGLLCHLWIEENDPDPSMVEVITYAHDAEGLVRAVTASTAGEPSRTTHLDYEAAERIQRTEQWNDLGQASWFLIHPSLGVVLASEDANGVKTHAQVDDLGRIVHVMPEDAGEVFMSYAPRVGPSGGIVGMSISTSKAAGGASRADLDVLGRRVGQGHLGFDGSWIEQAWSYDPLGRAVAVSRPGVGAPASATTRWLFDNLDRTVAEISPDVHTTLYDQSFFETTITDPAGHTRTLHRDADDRVVESVEETDGHAITTTYHFDPFRQVTRIEDTKANAITIAYDHRGRRLSISDPDAGLETFSYNGFGETTKTVRSAAVSQTTYDVLGRPTQVVDDDGTTTYVWDTRPHGQGKLAHAESPDGTIKDVFYDNVGRPQVETWTVDGDPFSIERTYDPWGRPKTIAYPEAPGRARLTIGQSYTPSGYLKEVHDLDDRVGSYWRADNRNSDDALTQATLGNGIISARAYDATTGRLGSFTEGPALAASYDYDWDGLVSIRTDDLANRIEAFDYDGVHRLDRWTLSTRIPGAPGFPDVLKQIRATDYKFDDLGNVLQAVVSGVVGQDSVYGDANGRPHALTQNVEGSYAYDDRGRQIQSPGRSVAFTAFDLPRTITTPDGVTQLWYDADHTRVKKDGPGGVVVSIGGLYERRETGGATQHVFYVRASEGPVAEVVYDEAMGTSAAVYLHRDPLGSVGAATDQAGAVLDHFYYEPFGGRRDVDGNPIKTAPPTASEVPLGFTGQRHDDELALIDYRGRVYDPAIRRFLTPDPLVADPLGGQSYDRYAYVLNNPVNLTDPSGLDSSGCIGLECYGGGGGGWDGSFGDPFEWIEEGVKWIFFPAGGTGAPTTGRVFAAPTLSVRDGRVASTPTGPSAPGTPFAGPNAQAWSDANDIAQQTYRNVPYAVAALIARNNAQWEANEKLRARRNLSTSEEDELWWSMSGTGGAPPIGYAHDAFIYSQNAGETGGVEQVAVAVQVATDTIALGQALGEGIAALRVSAAVEHAAGEPLRSFCFAAGTKVLMADRSTKSIEEISEGDVVLADDPQDAGGAQPRRVTQVHRTATYRLFHLAIGGRDGGEIVATGSHPFWTQRGWVTAENLTIDDILSDEQRRPLAIRTIAIESRDELTFNLSIDGTHTFFVVAGDTPVLVHNVDPWDVAFSRAVGGPNEVFQHGPWAGRTVGEAIAEARLARQLPAGLEFNAARYFTPDGDEVIAAINNRTLYVAQEAGIAHINPINDIDSAKAFGALEKQLAFAAKKGGTGMPFLRCP